MNGCICAGVKFCVCWHMHTYAQTQSIVCTDSAELVYFFTAYVHIYIYNHAPNAHNHAPNQTHVQVVTHPLSLSFARSLLLSLALFLSGARAVSLPRSLFPSLSVYFVARALLFFFPLVRTQLCCAHSLSPPFPLVITQGSVGPAGGPCRECAVGKTKSIPGDGVCTTCPDKDRSTVGTTYTYNWCISLSLISHAHARTCALSLFILPIWIGPIQRLLIALWQEWLSLCSEWNKSVTLFMLGAVSDNVERSLRIEERSSCLSTMIVGETTEPLFNLTDKLTHNQSIICCCPKIHLCLWSLSWF